MVFYLPAYSIRCGGSLTTRSLPSVSLSPCPHSHLQITPGELFSEPAKLQNDDSRPSRDFPTHPLGVPGVSHRSRATHTHRSSPSRTLSAQEKSFRCSRESFLAGEKLAIRLVLASLAHPPQVLSQLCPPPGRVLPRFLSAVALRVRLMTVSLLSQLTAASSPPPPPPPTFPVRCTSLWFLSNAPASLHPYPTPPLQQQG